MNGRLTAEQLRWLREEGQETFGLTPIRARMLIAVLERDRFGLRELGRLTNQAPDNTRFNLDYLVARDLVEVRLVGHPRRPKAFEGVPGTRLLPLLGTHLGAAGPKAGTAA